MSDPFPMRVFKEHTFGGNCWADTFADCDGSCHGQFHCTFCHEHSYPRGSCDQCQRCAACDERSQKAKEPKPEWPKISGIVIGVTGGRNYIGDGLIVMLNRAHKSQRGPVRLIIHGDCQTGADWVADAWALDNNVLSVPIGAPWDMVRSLCGQAGPAGPIRNYQLSQALKLLRRQMDVALIATPGGTGTANMKRKAKLAGVEIVEVTS